MIGHVGYDTRHVIFTPDSRLCPVFNHVRTPIPYPSEAAAGEGCDAQTHVEFLPLGKEMAAGWHVALAWPFAIARSPWDSALFSDLAIRLAPSAVCRLSGVTRPRPDGSIPSSVRAPLDTGSVLSLSWQFNSSTSPEVSLAVRATILEHIASPGSASPSLRCVVSLMTLYLHLVPAITKAPVVDINFVLFHLATAGDGRSPTI